MSVSQSDRIGLQKLSSSLGAKLEVVMHGSQSDSQSVRIGHLQMFFGLGAKLVVVLLVSQSDDQSGHLQMSSGLGAELEVVLPGTRSDSQLVSVQTQGCLYDVMLHCFLPIRSFVGFVTWGVTLILTPCARCMHLT